MKFNCLFLFVTLFVFDLQAGTVNYEDLPDDPLISMDFRCAKPQECRRLTPQDFLSGYFLGVKKGTEYEDINNQKQTAKENGFYVGFDDVFLSGFQIAEGPDEYYYYCQEGKNIVADDSLDDLLSPQDPILDTISLSCPSFWTPKKVHLDCNHIYQITGELPSSCLSGGESEPIFGQNSGGFYNGGYGTTGSFTGGGSTTSIYYGGSSSGGGSGGNNSGGSNSGGSNDGGGDDGSPPPSPVDAPSSGILGGTALVILWWIFG